MIDSDYDEDDEYQQCEIDEIFSISPTGEECPEFNLVKDEEGSEFDSEEPVVNERDCVDDDDDEYIDSNIDINTQMIKFGI